MLENSLKLQAKLCNLSRVFGCFTAETLIKTPTGFTKIKDIQIGDEVYSFDEELSEVCIRKVTHLFVEEVEEILEIHTQNEIIRTTRNHPFFVNGAFKDAEQIAIGEHLFTHQEKFIEVVALNYLPSKEKVYNFEVEENHCYFVGANGVLVLNACSNYRVLFMKAFPKFKKYGRKIEIHHRFPQEWFKNVLKGNKNNLSNLIPLGKDFHRKVVSPAWAKFKKEFPNPTKKQIYEKVKEIDKLIEQHLRTRGF